MRIFEFHRRHSRHVGCVKRQPNDDGGDYDGSETGGHYDGSETGGDYDGSETGGDYDRGDTGGDDRRYAQGDIRRSDRVRNVHLRGQEIHQRLGELYRHVG